MRHPNRILIVDDEPAMLRTVERVLRGAYEIVASSSPKEALVLAADLKPYVAILDIRMHEMDGFELMSALKQLDPDIRVILMTGGVYDVDEQLTRAIREEAFYYITKPFDRDVLLALIKRCIELRSLEDENRRHMQELEETLDRLQVMQDQLIVAEKMASLGRLSAGIAHEIRNPLNFVNNFAGMAVEMIGELEEACEAVQESIPKDVARQFKALLTEVKSNCDRIEHHGQRADHIVMNMLEHFGARQGRRQSTDIHRLLDDSIRLAYNHMKSEDDAFFATVQKEYDGPVDRFNVVPQDLSRAFFNLFDNAFYAVRVRYADEGKAFLPTVSVQTRKKDEALEIEITDNGAGIPVAIQDKIFEPFFTTKPTGTGTGLGLSVSYSVITYGHEGSLDVDSVEGEGASFKMTLPFNNQ